MESRLQLWKEQHLQSKSKGLTSLKSSQNLTPDVRSQAAGRVKSNTKTFSGKLRTVPVREPLLDRNSVWTDEEMTYASKKKFSKSLQQKSHETPNKQIQKTPILMRIQSAVEKKFTKKQKPASKPKSPKVEIPME